MTNLLGPEPTLLPDDHPDVAARAALEAGESLRDVAARFPAASYAWGRLATQALEAGDAVGGYAFARTGYHRGLDALRRQGGAVRAMSRLRTSPTRGSSSACSRWLRRPRRSVRTRRRSAAGLSRTTATRRPTTCSAA